MAAHAEIEVRREPSARTLPMAQGPAISFRGRAGSSLGDLHIPACAGSTSSRSWNASRQGAHPRMRGEHGGRLIGQSGQPGSSPHARGARSAGHVAWVDKGLIPACAGSTVRRPCRLGGQGAHPRMRGEHGPPAMSPGWTRGSSPHARGARHLNDVTGTQVGLIPACAGSTPPSAPPPGVSRAHPRMRGEHPVREHREQRPRGSSPHARGARQHRVGGALTPGLIPACAGSTPWTPTCGPPGGLIPACAGSTGLLGHAVVPFSAHPRMRGEHHRPPGAGPGRPGSSPHARGAPEGGFVRARGQRLIPACAGSTG